MGRTRKFRGDAAPLSIRIPDELVGELDAWVEEVQKSGIGTSNVTRSDIVRDIVRRALEERRSQRNATAKKRPR